MQNEIISPIKGIVKNINCKIGDSIDANVPLIIVEDKT
jgi:biotin carboxyl carrier protein